jgi:two-component system response regulator TctD
MDLPTRELALLRALMQRRRQAVSREHLTEAVFGDEAAGADAIDVLVHRLRKRLHVTGAALTTLRGVGYFLADEAASEPRA